MSNNELKDRIHGRVNIQIGKNGINEGVIDQIKDQFKNNRYLKIRFLDLHTFEDMDEASKVLADRANASVEDVRGKTCVLKRKKSQTDNSS